MDNVWFRTRAHKSGALQVWLPKSKLERKWLTLVPAVLGVSFLFSSAAVGFRLLGFAALFSCAVAFLRLSGLGLTLSRDGVAVVDLRRARKVTWDDVMGFVGDRTGGGGHCMLVRRDGSTIPLPGILEAEEMNSGEGEGDLSAIDELNAIVERYRRGTLGRTTVDTPGVSPGARRLSALG